MVSRDDTKVNTDYIIEDILLDRFYEVCNSSIKLSKRIRVKLNRVQQKVHRTNGNSKIAADNKK